MCLCVKKKKNAFQETLVLKESLKFKERQKKKNPNMEK